MMRAPKTRALLAALALVGGLSLAAAPADAGPTGPCANPGEMALSIAEPDGVGSVLIDTRYTWDGVSVKPNCDGQVTFLRTQNTGDMTVWAILPDKKKAPLWVQIDPGTDVTVTAKGTLNNLGLSSAIDVRDVHFQFTNPAA